MIVTSSFGTSTPCSEFDDESSADQSNAEKTMPTGWLRPSSAMAMPVNPMPPGKFSEYEAAVAVQQLGHADQAGDQTRTAASR